MCFVPLQIVSVKYNNEMKLMYINKWKVSKISKIKFVFIPLFLMFSQAPFADTDLMNFDQVEVKSGLSAPFHRGLKYLKSIEADPSDYFGANVVVSNDGSTLAVSAPMEDGGAVGVNGDYTNNELAYAGAVYIYRKDRSDEWQLEAYVKSSHPDARDNFGSAIDLSSNGRTLVVAAEFEDGAYAGMNGDASDNNLLQSGAVYIFERQVDKRWKQTNYIKASSPYSFGRFGRSISLSLDSQYLAIGALDFVGKDGVHQSELELQSSGVIYLFERQSDEVWSEIQKIAMRDGNLNPDFGYVIDLSKDGSYLVVGSPNFTNVLGSDSTAKKGSVELFQKSDFDQWVFQNQIHSNAVTATHAFGAAVSLSGAGDRLAIGDYLQQIPTVDQMGGLDYLNQAGAVYLYDRADNDFWNPIRLIEASNAGSGDHFGYALSLSSDGQSLAVGALDEDARADGFLSAPNDDSSLNAGAVYLFESGELNNWQESLYLKANLDTESLDSVGNQFGKSISLSEQGETLAIGAWRDSQGGLFSGATYIF